MKTKSNKASFLAAVALGAAVLAGSAIPSLAQTTTPQPQASVQTSQPTTGYGGWYGPTMWWPTVSNTSGTAPVAPQVNTAQPTTFWGCWWW